MGVVLVIPPPLYHNNVKGMFDEEDFDRMVDYVDYFSLMTYDYSSPQRPGPNSQILWGFNFYGYDYTSEGGSPMVGHEFIKVLNEGTSLNSNGIQKHKNISSKPNMVEENTQYFSLP